MSKRTLVMYAAEVGGLMVAELSEDGETKIYVGADEEWCERAGSGAYNYVTDTYLISMLRRHHVESKFRMLDRVVKTALDQKNEVSREEQA